MKARALELARSAHDPATRLNVLREYALAAVLRSLHESQTFQALSFNGAPGPDSRRFVVGTH